MSKKKKKNHTPWLNHPDDRIEPLDWRWVMGGIILSMIVMVALSIWLVGLSR